jgi:molybdopterin-containing oxidoreductase family membrane subunit
MAPWAAMLAFGLYCAGLCLIVGLNQTHMNNRFAFGLWIFLDLTVIALGAGAFFTGFLLYILKRRELRAVINSAVVIGLMCYGGAMAVLGVDVGQPLRAWFTFWYPNVHSMLAEVTFCISCYLTVLLIEYVPIVLKNRKLRQIPHFLVFEHELHKLVYVFAGVGTFLSFFHQGSLGGLYGVLRGRPFAFREELGIWPTTFFLFILSAAAVGPSFILLTTWGVQKISGKRLVRPQVLQSLGRISGLLLAAYVVLKTVDTAVWLNRTTPRSGFLPAQYYAWKPFDSAGAETPGAHGVAGFRRGDGLLRGGGEPVRADDSDAGAADAVFRPLPQLPAELAGDWDLPGSYSSISTCLLPLVPVL